MMLKNKVGTRRKKLIGSPQPQRALHNHFPKHKHEGLIILIVSLPGLSKCIMLESHVQHTTDQFTYVKGFITALSSQIEDMLMEQGQ